jgi:hypothetical protein
MLASFLEAWIYHTQQAKKTNNGLLDHGGKKSSRNSRDSLAEAF